MQKALIIHFSLLLSDKSKLSFYILYNRLRVYFKVPITHATGIYLPLP